MTTDELVEYYVDLLIIEYENLPKARETIDALVRAVVASQIYTQVLAAFDVDTAVGDQLDMLGTYRGARRQNFVYPNNFFALPEYGDVDAATRMGFALYDVTMTGDTTNTSPVVVGMDDTAALLEGMEVTGAGIPASTTILSVDSPTQITLSNNATATASGVSLAFTPADPSWFFLLYDTEIPSTAPLDDATMRELLKYLIAVQASDHSIQSLDLILQEFFGNDVTMADNQNMTVTYTNTGGANSFYELVASLRLLPAPAGVEVFAL